MAGKSSPAYEMTRALVARLRSDAPLNELLFSITDRIDIDDTRVWASDVHLPEDRPDLRSALPRVLIGTIEEMDLFEQVDVTTNAAPVTVLVHCFAPHDNEELAEHVDARVRWLLLSTWPSTARIISAGLVPVGGRSKRREPQFNDAWVITRQFRSANVGVLL